jgi:hypothetical protein
LLESWVSTGRVRELMEQGHLQGLAVTASSYGSGLHVTFYEALQDIVPWTRSQRIAVRDTITVQHLLASSAIPFVFPAAALAIDGHTEYFGDGSMRQAAPISPAVHLGAQRILVVGALVAGTVDRQAFGRELGGIAFADAFDTLDHVGPVFERALLALIDDLGRDGRADALDGFEFGRGGLVGIDCREGGGSKQGQQAGGDFLQHGSSFSGGRAAGDGRRVGRARITWAARVALTSAVSRL